MNMNKIITLIKREYKEAVFKKSFIIMTLLIPVLMIGFSVVPSLLMMMEGDEPVVLNVYDATGTVAPGIKTELKDSLKNGMPKYIVNVLTPNPADEAFFAAQKELIKDKSVNGFLYVPAGLNDSTHIRYYSRNVGDFTQNRRIRNSVNTILVNDRLIKSGIEPKLIDKLTRKIPMDLVKISDKGEENESDFGVEYFSTFFFVMILYMTLILYGQSIMRSIIQEKNSRITEVLLSSVNPFEMMAGKIFGQGAVGLTQYLIWSVVGIAITVYGASMLPIQMDSINLSPMLFVYFIIFYILGFFLFSTLYAGVGVITNTEQEAQQTSMPITLLLIVPIIMLGMLVKNPGSDGVMIMSMIPFFSPIIMFARINLIQPPALEIWGSVLLLVLTIIGAIWLVGKIYRVGILMQGKRPNLPEIMRWIRN